MRIKKPQVVIFMHETLLLNKFLVSTEIKEKFELDDKTFYRYIQELKAYYSNMFKQEKIIYNKAEKKYFLVNTN